MYPHTLLVSLSGQRYQAFRGGDALDVLVIIGLISMLESMIQGGKGGIMVWSSIYALDEVGWRVAISNENAENSEERFNCVEECIGTLW